MEDHSQERSDCAPFPKMETEMSDEASSPQEVEEVALDDVAEETATETFTEDTEDATTETSEEVNEEEAEEVEEIELNFGGEKLRFPKTEELEAIAGKVGELTHNLEAGYTKKYQDLAEQRKSVEARAQAFEKMDSLQGDALETFSRGQTLKREIAQLSAVDAQALWQSNPDQARRLSDTIAQKQSELATVVADVQAKESELEQAQQGEYLRMFEEGAAQVEKQVKGFKENHLDDVINYAVETYGLDREQAKAEWALNPPMAVASFKAMMFDRMQANARKASKPKPAEAKPVKALKGRGGKGDVDPDKMSTEQWIKMRDKQVRS